MVNDVDGEEPTTNMVASITKVRLTQTNLKKNLNLACGAGFDV